MATCKECGSTISFRKTDKGRMQPCEADGSDHFDKCSQLQMERIRREGTRFDTPPESGYVWKNREGRQIVKRDRISGDVRVGKMFVPPDHDCPTPPWEECHCDSTQTSIG